jgi:uncharacterized protein (UPF0276 family)
MSISTRERPSEGEAAGVADVTATVGPQVPPLGVGLLYNGELSTFLASDLAVLDYIEVIPDTFWTDYGPDAPDRYVLAEDSVAELDAVAGELTVVAHSIGFSLGSADAFESSYLEQIAGWARKYGFPWHSDHLSFARISGPDGHQHNAALAVPVPYDGELLDLIADRIESIQVHIAAAPFLIENNVYFVDIPNQEMTEPEFLNALSHRTGCGLLLDLHNVYTNARNHGFDALEFVDQLDLSRVVEIHIAGGSEFAGMYTDSHAGPCPQPVWQLLDVVAPRAENLAGVTFEFHESYYPLLGDDGIRRELLRARGILDGAGRG